MKKVTAIRDGFYGAQYRPEGTQFTVMDNEKATWFAAEGEEPLKVTEGHATVPSGNPDIVANMEKIIKQKDEEIAAMGNKLAMAEAQLNVPPKEKGKNK